MKKQTQTVVLSETDKQAILTRVALLQHLRLSEKPATFRSNLKLFGRN